MENKPKNKNLTSSFDDVVIEETANVPNGEHVGKITSVARDNQQFDYTRYMIEVQSTPKKTMLPLSFPTRVTCMPDGTPSSQHAKFLKVMGVNMTLSSKVGDMVNSTIGKVIKFTVIQKVTQQGTFSEIVKDTVRIA